MTYNVLSGMLSLYTITISIFFQCCPISNCWQFRFSLISDVMCLIQVSVLLLLLLLLLLLEYIFHFSTYQGS